MTSRLVLFIFITPIESLGDSEVYDRSSHCQALGQIQLCVGKINHIELRIVGFDKIRYFSSVLF